MSFPPVATSEQRDFTVAALGQLGVTNIRFAENWRRRGMDSDFTPLIQRVTALRQAGFSILLTVQSDGPDRACQSRNRHSCLISADPAFEDYIAGLLAAVGDDLDAIQFGNEWDSQFVGTAAEYRALHDRFTEVVRAKRPNLTIVLGGITGRAAYQQVVCVDQTPVAIEGLQLNPLLQQFCSDEAVRNARAIADVRLVLQNADYDVADIHLYDFEDAWPAAIRWVASLTRGRPVWMTEFGGPEPTIEPQDPDYQAQRLPDYLAVVNGLPVARAYYFKLTDDDSSTHDRSGLYDQRGRPKPALQVFSNFLQTR